MWQNLIINDYTGWDFRVAVGPVDMEATLTVFFSENVWAFLL